MIPRVQLAEVAQVNPRLPKGADETQKVSFLAMASISENGKVLEQETRILGETKKGYTYFERGDVLLAKITPCFENGKAAVVDDLEHPIGFGSTEFHVLRADKERLNSEYLFYLLWSDQFRFLGRKVMKGAAGHKRVPAEFLSSFEIPLPRLEDQARIAYLLGKVDKLIVERKQQLCQLNELLKSLFLDMFGDPVRDEDGWHLTSIGNSVEIQSGQVDPRELPYSEMYHVGGANIESESGNFINLKQAKFESLISGKYIFDSDYILYSKIRPNLNKVSKPDFQGVCSADIYPIKPLKGVLNRDFLRMLLMSKTFLSYAANNSDRANIPKINRKALTAFEFNCPPIDLQDKFSIIVEKIEGIKAYYQQSLSDLSALFGTLSQQALKGELECSRVPLPSIKLEAANSGSVEHVPRAASEVAINLPYMDNLADVLRSSQAREALIVRWLEVYLRQLGPDEFSIQLFLTAVQIRIAELPADDYFELGVKDYEHIKIWVFEALSDGRLKQLRDITDYDKKNEPIFGNRLLLKAGQI